MITLVELTAHPLLTSHLTWAPRKRSQGCKRSLDWYWPNMVFLAWHRLYANVHSTILKPIQSVQYRSASNSEILIFVAWQDSPGGRGGDVLCKPFSFTLCALHSLFHLFVHQNMWLIPCNWPLFICLTIPTHPSCTHFACIQIKCNVRTSSNRSTCYSHVVNECNYKNYI